MLGLLAHGLHLLLAVLGLAGVGALLLPQLTAARFSRAAAFRPPVTTAEHEPRVAELRRSFATTSRKASWSAPSCSSPQWRRACGPSGSCSAPR